MKIATLGLGYVGSVTSACLASMGHTVIGIDPSRSKVEPISSGRSPIVEPGLAELISDGVRSGRLSATTDPKDAVDADVAIVCVGTPSRTDGSLDLSYVMAAIDDLSEISHSRPNTRPPLHIMMRSTILPGTTKGILQPRIEATLDGPLGTAFTLSFVPEFLREATAVRDFFEPPFTVIGVDDPICEAPPKELFESIAREPEVVPTSVAEGVKYASNAFHALKVAFANEIARVTEPTGADPRRIMRLFIKDTQLNISERYLRPGFAYGGSCLPKDVAALARYAALEGVNAPLLQSLSATNDAHIDRAVRKVREQGFRRVAVIGLTFKPGTDDLRESPYLKVVSRLQEIGVEVKMFDPVVEAQKLTGANLRYCEENVGNFTSLLYTNLVDALSGVDGIVLGTNRLDICEYIARETSIPTIDANGMLSPAIETLLADRHQPSGSPSYMGVAW